MGTIHRFVGKEDQFEWEGVGKTSYDAHDVVGVVKKVLIGPLDGASNFRMRYFSVEPGGNTSLDQHPHDHGVIILHGSASVLLGEQETVLGPWDVVHVPGDEVTNFERWAQSPSVLSVWYRRSRSSNGGRSVARQVCIQRSTR